MYLDIFVGLCIGLLGSFISGEVNIPLVVFGVFAALAPDIDFIIYLMRHQWKIDQYSHEHRDILHKPLLFSVLIGIVLFVGGYSLYALLWMLGTTWHFMHDTYDGGWGIAWLYPLKKGYYTRASYSPQTYIATKEEQRKIATQHGTARWMDESQIRYGKKIALWVALGAGFFIFLFVISRVFSW